MSLGRTLGEIGTLVQGSETLSRTDDKQVVWYRIRFGDRWRGNDCQLVINHFDIAFFDALGDQANLTNRSFSTILL